MYRLIKRIFDIFISLVYIIILSPIFLLFALLVKLTSPGPIFYSGIRVGHYGKTFHFFKFRTMVIDADTIFHDDYIKRITKNEFGVERGAVFFKLQNDPRVTKFGRFLRKYSLDELPQLFNVLKGDMSIVGPRPPMIYEYEKFKDFQMKRLTVKPGMTGLWQVSGRSQTSFDEMIKLDLKYIDHQSFLLDIKIIFKTIPAVLFSKDAL